MALLWHQVQAQQAALVRPPSIPVRKAGFAGFVSEPKDVELHNFIDEHGSNSRLWKSKGALGDVDISKGVYATQSHIHPVTKDGQSPSQPESLYRQYLGNEHPLFVTHEGRLHVIDGHHRVARALLRGEKSIEGWHYDGDKHGLYDEDED